MARRRTTKSRSRRRNPRSTRRGSPRRTARLAYTTRRGNPRRRRAAPARRRRRNPRPMIVGTPAFRYGISALGGAVAANWINRMALEQTGTANGKGFAAWFVPEIGENGKRLHAGVLAAATTFALAMFIPRLKAQTRNTLIAAGTGMLVQPAIDVVGNIGGGAHGRVGYTTAPQYLSAPRQAPYNSALAYNNAAARFAGVRAS